MAGAGSFQTDKNNIVNVVKAHNCDIAVQIDQQAQSYADLINILFDNSKVFDCDQTSYLSAIFNVVDDATLVANGVYFNKTIADVYNPVVIAKCTVDNIHIDAGGNYDKLIITEQSTINNGIVLSNATILRELRIEGASVVNLVDSTAAGCCIGAILVRYCKIDDTHSNVSTLNNVKYQSCYEIFVDDGAVYDGETCPPTGAPPV